MNRTLPILGVGVLLGIIATLAFLRFDQPGSAPPDEVVRDIVDIPQMTEAVAEKHRDEQYATLVSIEDILALPTVFARTEALHVLAGRSDSGGVQNLIFEANRIADDIKREALLNILFLRLAESDPQSALALARMEQFEGSRSLEKTVWRTWARNDLDGALFAAKTQTTLANERFAARSLFEAFGYLGNDTTDRIAAELDVKPDRRTRGLYLYRLADKSPAEAIAYINSLEPGRERQEHISWLGYYLSLWDPGDALQYTHLFENAAEGNHFSTILKGHIAVADPLSAVEQMLAGGGDDQNWGQYHNAVRDLAASNLEATMRYFEQARSDQHRQILGSAITAELAKKDPEEALVWARANDRGRMPTLELQALAHIAQKDPQLALNEALSSSNDQMRSMLVSNLVQQIAMNDPADAIPYLEQIDNPQQRLAMKSDLASTWIQRDADAAVEWILSQDKKTSSQLMVQATHRLTRRDVDKAIALLPLLNDKDQLDARRNIARQLGESRSVEEAQAFVSKFQGEPDYERLQVSVVGGMARNDTLMAKQLADQIQDSASRDAAYVQVIGQHARRDPAEALRWLDGVADATMRSQAVGQIASQWYATDPAAATRWVSNLPRGTDRDNTIVNLATKWSEPTAEQTNLIASIEDRQRRGQAKLNQVYGVARTDPAKARAMLDDEDITDSQREQARKRLVQYGVRY